MEQEDDYSGRPPSFRLGLGPLFGRLQKRRLGRIGCGEADEQLQE
jgi:hypothetical protein